MKVFALIALLSALLFASCTRPRPFSLEENTWFDTATGAEMNGIETLGRQRSRDPAESEPPAVMTTEAGFGGNARCVGATAVYGNSCLDW